MSEQNNTPPPWPDEKKWRWRAQDADGEWIFYQFKPIEGDDFWRFASSYFGFNAGMGEPNPDWRDTLQKRPNNE